MLSRVVRRVHRRFCGASCCSLGLSALPPGLLSSPVGRNAFCTLYVTRHLRHRLLKVPPQGVDLVAQRGDLAPSRGAGLAVERCGRRGFERVSGFGLEGISRSGRLRLERLNLFQIRFGLCDRHRRIALGVGGDCVKALQSNFALVAEALAGAGGGFADRVLAP